MDPKIFIVLVGLLAVSHAETVDRIVNGTLAHLGQRPFQVYIEDHKDVGKEFVASGVIINANWVLTVASAMKHHVNAKHNLVVVAGAVDMHGTSYNQHKVGQILMHEGWTDDLSSPHNLAMLKVKIPIAVNEHVTFAHLPTMSENVRPNTMAMVSGWGSDHENGPPRHQMYVSSVHTMSLAECKKRYAGVGMTIQNTHLCAGDNWTGLCHHDIGNPLTIHGKLMGMSFHSHGCSHPEYPGVYTSIPAHVDWIKAHSAE